MRGDGVRDRGRMWRVEGRVRVIHEAGDRVVVGRVHDAARSCTSICSRRGLFGTGTSSDEGSASAAMMTVRERDGHREGRARLFDLLRFPIARASSILRLEPGLSLQISPMAPPRPSQAELSHSPTAPCLHSRPSPPVQCATTHTPRARTVPFV